MAGAVRQPIDVPALERYIRANVPDILPPLEVRQFGYGQSNPTYQLTASDGRRFVLRKKPPGTLLSKTAHKVDREYRILKALEHTDVPVPKAYVLCDDDAVLGTAFYIMDYLDGRIFADPALPDVTPAERAAMWHSAIDTLAALHRIPPARVGLDRFGKPAGFYDRQLNTFTAISDAQSRAVDADTGRPVGPIPHFPDMVAFFRDPRTQPPDRATLVHGDYKIDNLVFHPTEPRVCGILDWEMSTVGHPLSDLANLLSPYITPSILPRNDRTDNPFTRTPNLPTRPDLLARYRDRAGWDPAPDLPWADAFALFRGTVIMQGIAARHARRQASSASAMAYAAQIRPWADLAWDMIRDFRAAAAPSAGRPRL